MEEMVWRTTSSVSSQSKYFSNVDSAVREFFYKGQEGKYSGMKSGSNTDPGTQHDDLETGRGGKCREKKVAQVEEWFHQEVHLQHHLKVNFNCDRK